MRRVYCEYAIGISLYKELKLLWLKDIKFFLIVKHL